MSSSLYKDELAKYKTIRERNEGFKQNKKRHTAELTDLQNKKKNNFRSSFKQL